MKRIGLFLSAVWCWTLSAGAQNFSYEVVQQGDGVFYAPASPAVELTVANEGQRVDSTCVSLTVTTDDRRPVGSFAQQVVLPAGARVPVRFTFTVPGPGFYRCLLTDAEGTEIRRFNIGYEPEFIVSLGDAQPDLREFWDRARAELDAVDPE